MSNEQWNETKAILNELEQLFDRDDDVKDILDIQLLEKEVLFYNAQKSKTAKELIKTISGQVTTKETEITAPSQAEHLNNLKGLADKENSSSQLEQVIRSIENKKSNIQKTNNMTQTLKERSEEYTLSHHITDSRTAYALSLYSKISNITWDYDKCMNGKLSGCIGNEAKKELHNFELETQDLNAFEIANQLWSTIGENLLE